MKASLAILLALALASAACKGSDAAPSTPTVTTSTENFGGTVQVKGADIHNFTVPRAGQVSVTLTAAGPPSTIAMGVGVGTPGDGACGVLTGGSVTTGAGSSAQLTGVVSPGTLCVKVFDVGNQTGAIAYTVTVVHP